MKIQLTKNLFIFLGEKWRYVEEFWRIWPFSIELSKQDYILDETGEFIFDQAVGYTYELEIMILNYYFDLTYVVRQQKA